jgi:hypothetical protein
MDLINNNNIMHDQLIGYKIYTLIKRYTLKK